MFSQVINKFRPCMLISRKMSSLTLVSEENGVRKITLNNPKRRNALSLSMIQQIKDDINRDIDNITLRCIVLNSSSDIFSSGHDLKELKEGTPKVRTEIFSKCTELMLGIRNIPVPVIAQIKGLAAAAGCQLAASCDIVIAGENARFSTPGASVGLFCSTPGIAVSRAVHQKMASYMLLTGNTINAKDALAAGLISRIVPDKDLDRVTDETVQAILAKSRSVIALGKKFYYEQLQCDIQTAYQQGTNVMVENLAKVDAQEGISAFFEKRLPKWNHE